ncbi:hypothetical protein MIMGU_mgv1a016826mg [Erythranthe guttata]|uniref:Uncharacterized protein n=1 Tax=Erythranthe guttata TaxID=4155 RepID=A0A022QNH5_ERYGU|nr:hypothetical protein MIMGU_mgv1a016826mg [Erythranthe guttata]
MGSQNKRESNKRLGTTIGIKGLTLLPSLFLLSLSRTYFFLSSPPHSAFFSPSAKTSGGGSWYGHFDRQEVSGSPNLEALLKNCNKAHLMSGGGDEAAEWWQRSGG